MVQTRFATTALALLRGALGRRRRGAGRRGRARPRGRRSTICSPPTRSPSSALGPAVGLTFEAALKTREAAQFWAESYPAMDYRHGPIAIAQPGRLVWSPRTDAPRGLPDDVAATGAHLRAARPRPASPGSSSRSASRSRWLRPRGLDPDHPRSLTRSVILTEPRPRPAAVLGIDVGGTAIKAPPAGRRRRSSSALPCAHAVGRPAATGHPMPSPRWSPPLRRRRPSGRRGWSFPASSTRLAGVAVWSATRFRDAPDPDLLAEQKLRPPGGVRPRRPRRRARRELRSGAAARPSGIARLLPVGTGVAAAFLVDGTAARLGRVGRRDRPARSSALAPHAGLRIEAGRLGLGDPRAGPENRRTRCRQPGRRGRRGRPSRPSWSEDHRRAGRHPRRHRRDGRAPRDHHRRRRPGRAPGPAVRSTDGRARPGASVLRALPTHSERFTASRRQPSVRATWPQISPPPARAAPANELVDADLRAHLVDGAGLSEGPGWLRVARRPRSSRPADVMRGARLAMQRPLR